MAVTTIKVGDWPLARRIMAAGPRALREAVKRAVWDEANLARTKIVEGLRDQAPGGEPFLPLSASTILIRRFRGFRGTKALIVRADLRRSVVVYPRGPGLERFVGVLRTARNREGRALANIAELNEFGSRPIVIKITPKMVAFLRAALGDGGGSHGARSAGKGFVVVKIPARPFIRPVMRKHFEPGKVRSRFAGRVAGNLARTFGRAIFGGR